MLTSNKHIQPDIHSCHLIGKHPRTHTYLMIFSILSLDSTASQRRAPFQKVFALLSIRYGHCWEAPTMYSLVSPNGEQGVFCRCFRILPERSATQTFLRLFYYLAFYVIINSYNSPGVFAIFLESHLHLLHTNPLKWRRISASNSLLITGHATFPWRIILSSDRVLPGSEAS